MRTTILVLSLIISLSCQAQRHNANWCFGQNAGLSFMGNNSGSAPKVNFAPMAFSPTINTSEGVATISNKSSGTMIFYFNNGNLYDKSYNIMPNGAGISSDKNGTSAQGVSIVPVVSDLTKFYVFTVGGPNGLLAYSVVDSLLNGGMGDVVAGQKFIPIDSGFSEAITVVEGCKGYWLLVYKQLTDSFYAYRIASSGIDTIPVLSAAAYPMSAGSVVSIKISPDRSLLGLTSTDGSFVAMHDFDPLTGMVTNSRLIDTSMNSGAGFYGCDFSPDSRLFYASASIKKEIYQYDLTQNTIAAVIASRKTVHKDTLVTGAIQLGPDGHIYIAKVNATQLDRIKNANAIFPNCIYEQITAFKPSGAAFLGLPQRIVRPIRQEGDSAFTSVMDKTDCLTPSSVIRGPAGMNWYKWHDGSTADSFVSNSTGVYWVTANDGCATFIDTIGLNGYTSLEWNTVHDTLCAGDSMTLFHYRNLDQPGSSWIWNTGSTNHSINISEPGQYRVTMKNKFCHTSIDTFNIAAISVPFIPTHDAIICPDDTIDLSAGIFPDGTHVKWDHGDTGIVIKVYDKGIYTFVAEYQGCEVNDRIELTQYPRIMIELGNDREICSDKSIVLPLNVTSEETDKYRWQNGSIGRSFRVTKSGTYYVEVVGHCQTVRDTVEIIVRPCNLFFPSVFSPNGDGTNDIAHLVGDIANVSQFELHIFHRWGQEVFSTNDVYSGWDGTHGGKLAGQATYYYYMKFRYMGNDEMRKGSLQLLR